MNRNQRLVIEYLLEEVKILREIQGEKRLRFTDEQMSRGRDLRSKPSD
jgi:hypothetical protein